VAGGRAVLQLCDNCAHAKTYYSSYRGFGEIRSPTLSLSLSGQTEKGRGILSHARFFFDPLKILANRHWRCLFHIGFAEKLRRLFRRRGIDIEPRAPLESGRLGQFGHELDVPMVVIVGRILDG
jgi:hypothetical protein